MSNSGILLVDKPSGMTSHDLVSCARKIFHTKKIGHNGTLDPDATGVMVLCVGQATRLNEYLTADDKFYRATLRFGQETDTQDISGHVTASCAFPSLDEAGFCEVLTQFLGSQKQTPPVYSAIKKDGKPLYQYAREGVEIPDIPQREIEIFSLTCVSYTPEEAVFDVHCSKGTYIRTLCQDIARACGSCGCMAALRRTAAGTFDLSQCVTLEDLQAAEEPYALLVPMANVLDMPRIVVESEAARADLMNGKRIPLPVLPEISDVQTRVQAIYDGSLLAVGVLEDDMFVPKKVFHE